MDTLNDLSSQIKTDFGGYKLMSKLIVFGMLEKVTVDKLAKNWCILKFESDWCMSQQMLIFSVFISDIRLKFYFEIIFAHLL